MRLGVKAETGPEEEIQATTVQLIFKCILFTTIKFNADFIRFILFVFFLDLLQHKGNREILFFNNDTIHDDYAMEKNSFFLQITFTFCNKTR